MKEAFYSITFVGASGSWGFGMIVMDTGKIIGADVAGARYDGSYQFNKRTNMIDASIKLTVPAGVELVQGTPAQPNEWTLEFQASLPPDTQDTPIGIDTPAGPVNVVFKHIRDLP